MAFLPKLTAWAKRTEGSAAVEFALVCMPFIYMTIAIIELSLFFTGANMMESGVNASARMIRTGQLQTNSAGSEEQAFKADLCNRLFVLIDCNQVVIEAIPMPSNEFSDASGFSPQYDSNGKLVSQGFDAGGQNDIILIRAAYRYKLWTPLFASIFSATPDNAIPIVTTVVLQTEPYL